MNDAFKQLNEVIAKSEHKQFITYCYNNMQGQRLTCIAKRAGNFLYIKIYTVNPKEQFSKKYIKDYHNQHGFYSNVGILHVVSCDRTNYKNLFFEVLSKHYILNAEAVNSLLQKQARKNERYNQKQIQNQEVKQEPLQYIQV